MALKGLGTSFFPYNQTFIHIGKIRYERLNTKRTAKINRHKPMVCIELKKTSGTF